MRRLIVCGDFNDTEASETLRQLTVDPNRAARLIPLYHDTPPTERNHLQPRALPIDDRFPPGLPGDASTLRETVTRDLAHGPSDSGSDHNPVSAQFRLPRITPTDALSQPGMSSKQTSRLLPRR